MHVVYAAKLTINHSTINSKVNQLLKLDQKQQKGFWAKIFFSDQTKMPCAI